MEMTEAHESLSATQDFCSPPPRASKSFLQELDEAAAKLDSALKEVSFQEEHSISVSRDVSQLWEEADDDDLSDEIYNLKFSTGTLQQELDRYSFDQPHPNEDMDFRNTNADHRPDVIFEEEEPLFLSQDDDKEEEGESTMQASSLMNSFELFPGENGLSISPIKPQKENELTASPIKSYNRNDSNIETKSYVEMTKNCIFHDKGKSSWEESTKEDTVGHPIFRLTHDKHDVVGELSQTLAERERKALVRVVSQDSECEANRSKGEEPEYDEILEDSLENSFHHTKKKKTWLSRRVLAKPKTVMKPDTGRTSKSTEDSEHTTKRNKFFSVRFPKSRTAKHKKSTKNILVPRVSNADTSTAIATNSMSNDGGQPKPQELTGASSRSPPRTPIRIESLSNIATPTTTNTTTAKVMSSQTSERLDTGLGISANSGDSVKGGISHQEDMKWPDTSSLINDRERVVTTKLLQMIHSLQDKQKQQDQREQKLVNLLKDAWCDRKNLLATHEVEVQQLQSQYNSADESCTFLKQENDLLVLQCNALKDIDGQASKRKVEQVKQENQELKEEIHELRKELATKLEEANYKTDLIKEHFAQMQQGYEKKLEVYIREQSQMEQKYKYVEEVYKERLKQEKQRTQEIEAEISKLSINYEAKLQEQREIQYQAAMNFEIANNETQSVQRELAELRQEYKYKLDSWNVEKHATTLSLEQLQKELEQANEKIYELDSRLQQAMKDLQHEQASRLQLQRKFENLLEDNLCQKQKLDDANGQMQVQIQEIHRYTSENSRLNQIIDTYKEVEKEWIKELQEAREELNQLRDKNAIDPTSLQHSVTSALNALHYELQVAESNELKDEVTLLKVALEKSGFSPRNTNVSPIPFVKSPVEQKIRDQVKRLKASLTPKKANDRKDQLVFWSDEMAKVSSNKTIVSQTVHHSNSKSATDWKEFADKENNSNVFSPMRKGTREITRLGLGGSRRAPLKKDMLR